MAALPQVHVFIPQLFAPLRLWQQDFAFEAVAPALMALLAKYQQQPLPVSGVERSILHRLGMDVQAGVPWAALRHQFESGGMYAPPLMCADPVCMQSGLDAVTIQAETPLLPVAETGSLLSTLNQHLAQDGLVLKAFHPQRWYLHALDDTFSHPLPETTPLSEVGSGNVFPCLPRSSDKYWAQLFNELQMLLHSHALNQQREARGQQAVNGVWLWGEGQAPPCPTPGSLPASGPQGEPCTLAAIQGGGLSGEVLAEYMAVRWSAQPDAALGEGATLVILDQLQVAAAADQPQLWQAALDGLGAYLEQLLALQRRGDCAVTLYDADGQSWVCLPPGGWFRRGRRAAGWAEFVG